MSELSSQISKQSVLYRSIVVMYCDTIIRQMNTMYSVTISLNPRIDPQLIPASDYGSQLL